MIHADFKQPQACHQWCFVGSVDPALDPANQVTADKAWLNTAFMRLFYRDKTNTSWLFIGN